MDFIDYISFETIGAEDEHDQAQKCRTQCKTASLNEINKILRQIVNLWAHSATDYIPNICTVSIYV